MNKQTRQSLVYTPQAKRYTKIIEPIDELKPKKAKDLAVIGSDAVSALYGMTAGPAFSVVEGAIFSSFAALN